MTERENDIELGKKVFRSFWDWSHRLNSNFKISFEDFLNSYGKKRDIYLEGVGLGVRSSGISDTRISSAMRSMAQQSQGKIPKDPQKMFQFMSNESIKIDWVDAVVETTAGSLGDVADGFQAVGNSIIASGKFLNFILPAVIVLFVFFWLNKQSGGELGKLAGKAARGLRK